MSSQTSTGEGGCFLVREVLRDHNQRMSRESPVLREHAWRDSPKRTIPTFGGVLPMDMVGAEVGTDALADFPALDAGTDCDDLEGSIGCWDQVVCRGRRV